MKISSMRYLLSVVLIAGLMVGCSSDDSEQTPPEGQQKPQQQQQPQKQQQQQGPQQGQDAPNLQQKQQTVDPSSITDEELKKFAEAMQKAQKIQSEARSDMQTIVEDEGLTFKRFQQIMMSRQSPKMKDKVDVTDEEQEKMDNIQPQMEEAQKSARKDITEAIESTGISMERFKEIGQAMRQNKELLKRYKQFQPGPDAQDGSPTP